MKKEALVVIFIVLFSAVGVYWFFFRKHECCGMHMQKTLGTYMASDLSDASCGCSVGGVCNCMKKYGTCNCEKMHKNLK